MLALDTKTAYAIDMTFSHGFTIVELMFVMVVVAILLAIGISADGALLGQGRNSERASDVNAIKRVMEEYYRTNASVSGPSYPTTTQVSTSLSTILNGADPAITIAPGQSTNSLTVAADTSSQTPGTSVYIYQPLTSTGTLCTAAPCARFRLYYRTENDNLINVIESLRQQ